ncbi:hypothetical protein RHSIM_RhsimUnG0050900 [Rhododendron simsii]|uniref:Uncharacterized protein n=1 Tax=Rhododendron simsii TaxID=118357 RepID=A0A834L5G8_RHOSS|nr:hypothetical protein RHSIM_RhsimUnG0050900 [Rhododendron simsii]
MKRSHSQILSGIEPTKLPEEEDYKHLYVIISYATGAYSHSLHRIRVADLKSCSSRRKLNNLPKPIQKLPCSYFPTSMGFFSVGSKIYMVGGGEITFGLKDIASRRCYVLDTCDDPIYRIRDVPPLNCEKLRPIVLGPLRGKFYVLDRTLASGDLEEFDPKTESWTLLPPPPIDPIGPCADRFEEKLDDYKVLSYGIVEDQILFSTRKGIYAVNVCSKKWSDGAHWVVRLSFPFVNNQSSWMVFGMLSPTSTDPMFWPSVLIGTRGFENVKILELCFPLGL